MYDDELRQVLSRLHDSIGQRVSIRCFCENLEDVYIDIDEHGETRVGDGHKTFQYLDQSGDETYVPLETIDLAAVRELVNEFRVTLVDASPDVYPSIECRLLPGQPIADAVDRVSRAIDGVFHLATRPDLK